MTRLTQTRLAAFCFAGVAFIVAVSFAQEARLVTKPEAVQLDVSAWAKREGHDRNAR